MGLHHASAIGLGRQPGPLLPLGCITPRSRGCGSRPRDPACDRRRLGASPVMDTDTECSVAAMSESVSPATGTQTSQRRAGGSCAEGFHDWDDWYALTSSPEIEYRYCGSCSSSEERTVAPDHRVYPLVARSAHRRGPTQVHLGPYIPDLGDPR